MLVCNDIFPTGEHILGLGLLTEDQVVLFVSIHRSESPVTVQTLIMNDDRQGLFFR